MLLAACGEGAAPVAPTQGTPPGGEPRASLVSEQEFLARLDRTRGWKDCFEVIRDPALLPADGAHGVRDGDPVLCVDVSSFAAPGAAGPFQACYPTALLDHHEIVEHTMAGLELLACW